MTYLIGFSGPPRAGKDTIAQELQVVLAEQHPGLVVQSMALSTPMREVVYALLGQEYSVEHYERHKDDPQEVFGGKSIRWAMIDLSEKHVKPEYGKDFWGRSALARIWDEPKPQVVIVTDMGFQAEVDLMVDTFGSARVCFPQITRPGCDFSNDSRSYVGVEFGTSIINDGEITTAARRLYGRLMNQFSWNLG